jgi:hypothetical protein
MYLTERVNLKGGARQRKEAERKTAFCPLHLCKIVCGLAGYLIGV